MERVIKCAAQAVMGGVVLGVVLILVSTFSPEETAAARYSACAMILAAMIYGKLSVESD